MSLGPATGVQEQPPTQLEDKDFLEDDPSVEDDDWGDQISVIPEKPQVADPPPDPKIAQVVNLVQEVNGFMQGNDVHRFWRRHISRSLHRHIGYNGWPKVLQKEFDERFKEFLSDPQFISSICKKIISMELGHALGVKHVVAFITATAGFTAFTLIGID